MLYIIPDLAAASSSRKDATTTLLANSISDNSFVIHSSREHLLCNKVTAITSETDFFYMNNFMLSTCLSSNLYICNIRAYSFARRGLEKVVRGKGKKGQKQRKLRVTAVT